MDEQERGRRRIIVNINFFKDQIHIHFILIFTRLQKYIKYKTIETK